MRTIHMTLLALGVVVALSLCAGCSEEPEEFEWEGANGTAISNDYDTVKQPR